jgi:ribosome-associated heat shock protein Hsp15
MAERETRPAELDSQRLDKWLWAARFFKTRSLAVEAIEGGRVHVDGQRAKPARAVRAG